MIEKANSLTDVDRTVSPETTVIFHVPALVAEFILIMRMLCPTSRVDEVFADFHQCIRNLPEEMRLEEHKLHVFGVDYLVTMHVTQVKGDKQEFQVLMVTYEQARQVVKDLENVLMKMHADDILDQLLDTQICLQDVRKCLDGFAEYRVETLKEHSNMSSHLGAYEIYDVMLGLLDTVQWAISRDEITPTLGHVQSPGPVAHSREPDLVGFTHAGWPTVVARCRDSDLVGFTHRSGIIVEALKVVPGENLTWSGFVK
ncbi:hypothetical protein V8D89_014771 [Ganoderma adspersum]